MTLTRKEIGKEIVKVAVLGWLLHYAFNNANFPDVLWKPAMNIGLVGVSVVVYTVGRIWGKVLHESEESWKAYLYVFYVVGILTLMSWGTYGTYTDEDGYTVVEFIPTAAQRDDSAITSFLSLLIPALYGTYKGKNLKPNTDEQ